MFDGFGDVRRNDGGTVAVVVFGTLGKIDVKIVGGNIGYLPAQGFQGFRKTAEVALLKSHSEKRLKPVALNLAEGEKRFRRPFP